MMEWIDGIISLCFTEAGIENEFHFKFGEKFNDVISKLKQHNLKLIEIENIKLDEDIIINDVIKKLEDENNI